MKILKILYKEKLEIVTYLSINSFIILYTNLSNKYKILKYIALATQFFAVIEGILSNRIRFIGSKLKNMFLFFASFLYLLRKEKFCLSIYNKYSYFVLIINILMMTFPPLYDKNYHLCFQVLLSGLLVPRKLWNLKTSNIQYKWFTIYYITTFLIFYTFEHSFRFWSLCAMSSIIPMIFNKFKDPWLFRVYAVGFMQIIAMFKPDYQKVYADIPKSLFHTYNKKIVSKNYKLSNYIFKYNDWRKTPKLIFGISIYNFIIIINYIILMKTIYVTF